MKKGIAASVLITTSALAADLTGKWSGSFKVEGGDHNIAQCFRLSQHGKSPSGSSGPDASEPYPIENGSLESDEAAFPITTGEWKFIYHLRQLSGIVSRAILSSKA